MQNWTKGKLGDLILEIKDGGTPMRSKREFFGGDIAWIVIDDIKDEIEETKEYLTEIGLRNCSSNLWDEGDIILSTGATIGIVGITKVKAATKQGISGIKTRSSSVDNHYLKYWFQLNRDVLIKNSQGSTIKEIRPTTLVKLPISLPTLITEQKRIAEILSTADEAIERTQALIDKYNRIKRGLMQDLLTRGVDANGNIRSKQTHQFTVKNGIEVPDDWDVVRLDTFANLITSGSRGWAKYYSVEGDKFIRIGNLTREKIDLRLENLVFVNAPHGSEGNRTSLKPDDLLISITADLGIVGIVPPNFGRAYINQHIALIRFESKEIFPRWIAYFLASHKGQFQFQQLNESGAKAGLNLPTVASLLIAVPKIEEQKEIVKNLDASLEIISKEKIKLAKLQAIKKGLMQDLLSGKKRVKTENENGA